MAYTTINKSTDYFNTKIYTGNGGTQSINVGFQPDWSWFKSRDASNYHALIDAVRGETKVLYSNGTDVEATYTAVDFTSTGYDLTHNSSLNSINSNGSTKVAWNWLANGTGSANTAGTINSTVSVNTTAGFSIVSYTGNGTGGATVGHGLGVAPSMIIEKGRSVTDDWLIYHKSIGATKGLALNNTTAEAASTGYWNDTAPTSSLFTIGNNGKVNTNGGTHVAYCFAEKTGYSKFGSYTGNGNADGTFVYTGFKPAFVILKTSNLTGGWYIKDSIRSGGTNPNGSNPNETDNPTANTSNAENKASAFGMDILSNGFKLRATDGYVNFDGGNYIYMAFAEAPLVGTNGVTAKAR